jgi:hypothetical protein
MPKVLETPFVALGSKIPRIIHQTFASEIPDTLQDAVAGLTSRNPLWEHRLYNNKDVDLFILNNYGKQYQKIYRMISPEYGAARADFFRYLLMYKVGGVYLDLKSSFDRPIDEVISRDESYVLAKWRNEKGEVHEGWGLHDELRKFPRGEFQQWHIIATAGHPFLRAVIDSVVRNIINYDFSKCGAGWSGVLNTTGPIAYTKAIAPLVSDYPCTIIDNESIMSLTYSVLPKSSHINLDKNHYIRRTTPVVFRTGGSGVIDRSAFIMRTYKSRLRSILNTYRRKILSHL